MARYSRAGLRRAERVRKFLASHITLTNGPGAGKKLVLEDWQWKHEILPVFGTLKRDGRRRYTKALFGVPRWHDKTTTAAALAHYFLAAEPVFGGEEYAVATTLKQAGLTFDMARRMGYADPLLSRLLDMRRKIIEVRETGSSFVSVPHNADTAQGYHPYYAAVDELHVHKTDALLNAMISGSIGYPEPLILVITTAGERRGGVWWETMKRWRKDPSAYVYWCGASDSDDGHDPAVWRKANPASWITDDMLLEQYQTLPFAAFERYHLNRAPKAGGNRVFTEKRWAACGDLPRIDPERPCVVAVDASLRRDHTAVVLDQVDGKGRHNVICFTFVPEDDPVLGSVDREAVGALLRELCESFNVRRMVFDRAFIVDLIRDLLDEGLPVEEFSQIDQSMARACQRVFDVVREERMRHGMDPALTEHVLNAAIRETRFGYRFTKPSEEERIDAAIALAMAVDIAEVEAQAGSPGILVG